MIGVKFNDKHSLHDLGLFLQAFTIGVPEVKRQIVEIQGMQGSVDLSEALDETFYKNRLLTFEFVSKKDTKEALVLLSRVEAYLHGKVMEVVLDDDPRFYYKGMVSVNSFKTEKRLGYLVIDVDAEPYKYEINFTGSDWLWDPFDFETGIIKLSSIDVSGSKTVDLLNRAMITSPVFTATKPMKVKFNNITYNLPAGRTKVYDIRLCEGSNLVTFIGNGRVQIEYKGGVL